MSDAPCSPRPPHPDEDPFAFASAEREELDRLATCAAASYQRLKSACAAKNASTTTVLTNALERSMVPTSVAEAPAAAKDLAALRDAHRRMVEEHGFACSLVRSIWEPTLDPQEIAAIKCDRLL